MKVKPMGMLWMMLAGSRNSLPGAAWRALELLPEGRLMDRMNKFTLLVDPVGWASGVGRQRGWPVRLADGSNSSGHVTPAVFAATCLA